MEMNHLCLQKEGKLNLVNTIEGLIQEYFENHKGEVKYAFLTSYDGMDVGVLENLLLSLPGGNKLIMSGRYDVFCGAKKQLWGVENIYLAEMLLENVHRVYVENAFHPKIYLFYYLSEDRGEEKIFLIISSKNITKSSFLDAYACFEGVKTTGTTNGKQLKEILTTGNFLGMKELPEKTEEALKKLDEYQFVCFDKNAEVSFHRPNKILLDNIITKDSDAALKTIVVSPFATIKVKKDVCLYTSEETTATLTEKPEGRLFYLNNIRFNRIPSLHAKIYIKHRVLDARTEVWIGSANFTVSAFSDRNSEILACLSYEDKDRKIYTELAKAFEQKIDESFLWQEVDSCVVESGDTSKMLIPVSVYKELDEKLKVIPQKVDDTSKWNHTFEKIEISGVEDIEIRPKVSFPTRNGSVVFKYVKGDKIVDGSFSFDLVSKITDLELKRKYTQALEKHIDSECKKRNARLLTHSKNPGVRPFATKEVPDSKKHTTTYLDKKVTLFDVVLKKKMNSTKKEIQNDLIRYKNNYIGILPKEEEWLIDILTEE